MTVDDQHLEAGREAWSLMSQLFWDLRPRMLNVAAEFGLTPPQLHALKALDPQRPVPMRELAAVLQCDSSNVTGLVDRLTAQGLVERREAANDRRVRMLAVTEKGVGVRDRLAEVMRELPPGLARLGPAEMLALRDVMRATQEPPTAA